MRLLFEIDKKDYDQCTHSLIRNSARSIIIKDGKIAMVHSTKHDYYKIPGGGIEHGEQPIDALIRETREEAGLTILVDTIQEYGYVHRIQKSTRDEMMCFIQDNYYFLCMVEDKIVSQDLDEYEAKEGYSLEFVEPETAIRKNRCAKLNSFEQTILEREAMVLELLISDGLFKV